MVVYDKKHTSKGVKIHAPELSSSPLNTVTLRPLFGFFEEDESESSSHDNTPMPRPQAQATASIEHNDWAIVPYAPFSMWGHVSKSIATNKNPSIAMPSPLSPKAEWVEDKSRAIIPYEPNPFLQNIRVPEVRQYHRTYSPSELMIMAFAQQLKRFPMYQTLDWKDYVAPQQTWPISNEEFYGAMPVPTMFGDSQHHYPWLWYTHPTRMLMGADTHFEPVTENQEEHDVKVTHQKPEVKVMSSATPPRTQQARQPRANLFNTFWNMVEGFFDDYS
ncbi:MAG: hypothetical protein K2X98_05970 [Alphaproteobacteria bacterium]|nr:hypothetical protein [Alphaproteobacteria bacterium]